MAPFTFKVPSSGVLGVDDPFPVQGWMLVKWRQVSINETNGDNNIGKSNHIFSSMKWNSAW